MSFIETKFRRYEDRFVRGIAEATGVIIFFLTAVVISFWVLGDTELAKATADLLIYCVVPAVFIIAYYLIWGVLAVLKAKSLS